MNRYKTIYLLELSRYPEHFYPLNKGLEGRDIIYSNPGTSLRSFVCAGPNLLQEFLDVKDEMEEIVMECHSFCTDEAVIHQINEAMRDYPYEIAGQVLDSGGSQKAVSKGISYLNTLNRLREDLFDQLAVEKFNLFGDTGTEYKQVLIDIKYAATDLLEMLEGLKGRKT